MKREGERGEARDRMKGEGERGRNGEGESKMREKRRRKGGAGKEKLEQGWVNGKREGERGMEKR